MPGEFDTHPVAASAAEGSVSRLGLGDSDWGRTVEYENGDGKEIHKGAKSPAFRLWLALQPCQWKVLRTTDPML
jgi:hypothetical protein